MVVNGSFNRFQQISTGDHPGSRATQMPNDTFFWSIHPPNDAHWLNLLDLFMARLGPILRGNLMNLELGGWDISHGKKCFLMSHYTIPHSPILESWYTGDGEFRIVTLNSDCKWFSEWIKEWTAKEQTNERMNEWMKQQKSWVNQFVNDWMKKCRTERTNEWLNKRMDEGHINLNEW